MFRTARRLLIGPLLAVSASGAFLAGTAGPASAADLTATVTGNTVYRTQASESSESAGEARANARVSISCKVNGQYVRGNVRQTTQWDRLTNGKYLSHAHVDISKKIPACPPTIPAVPAPTAPTGPLPTVSNAAFLAAAIKPAQASQREFNVPTSVTLAQAILESGWGKSKLSANDNNYFGMKCFGNPGGIAVSCHDYVTQECDKVTQTCSTTTATFRVYNSPTDSFRDHGRQLSTLSRYAPAFTYAKLPNQFAAEIHKAGYATDLTYTDKLVALMVKYNLYQYDLP